MSFSEQITKIRNTVGRFLWPLKPVWTFLKLSFFAAVLFYGVLEIMTPSMKFAGDDHENYRSATQPQWFTLVSQNGLGYRAYRTSILTSDYRDLQVDVILPQNLPQSLPLTIVAADFIKPEQMLDWVQPRGNNAIVIYRSPRLERILGPSLPFWSQISSIDSINSFWNVLGTNPISKWYATYEALHEAPYDLSEIARWAQDTLQIDGSRINLVGLGSGSLVAAAAAHRMQSIGFFPRTLTLVYPPADLKSVLQENFFYIPSTLRTPLSYALAFVYRRLDINRHLPFISGTDNKRLIIIPDNAWDISTEAATPTLPTGGYGTDVIHIDVNHASTQNNQTVMMVHDKIVAWLMTQRAIGGF